MGGKLCALILCGEPALVSFYTRNSQGLADTARVSRSSCLPSGLCSLESLHRVHSDMQQVLGHLTHPRFTFTESEADADILYHFSHFKDYRWVPGSPRGLIPRV